MGLFKSKNELFQRIKRLVYPQQNRSVKEKFVPALVLLMTFGCFTWYSLKVQAQFKPKEVNITSANPQMDEPMVLNGLVTVNNVWDTIPEIVEEPLPPMEPEEELEEIVEMEWVEGENTFDFGPTVEILEELELPILPDMDFNFFFEMDPELELAVAPQIAPDIDVWVEANVPVLEELEALPELLGLAELAHADTNRKNYEKILEANREVLEELREQLSEDQSKIMEDARAKLRESLTREKPDDLTEEEWAEAKEHIRRAERQLERSMEQSQRSLERALKAKEEAFLHLEEELARNSHLHGYGNMDEDAAREMRDAARRYRDAVRSIRDTERHRNREIQRRIQRQHREQFDRYSDHMEHYKESLQVHKEHLKQMKEDLKDVKKEMAKDGLIDSAEDKVHISLDKDSIKVNGKKLKGKQYEKYRKLFDKHLGWDVDGKVEYKSQ
jgi:hypothetical protein